MASRAGQRGQWFVADFETSVYDGQQETEVWAAAITPITKEPCENQVTVTNSIGKFFLGVRTLGENPTIYFHNLKFDGQFIVDYLLRSGYTYTDAPRKEMENRQFKTLIDGSGAWYSVTVRTGRQTIEFRDSLKLLPFSVRKIGKDFKTKYQKSSIEYKGERHANGHITAQERDYIARDVLVMAEAMGQILDYGNKMTIGANCMSEFKGAYKPFEWNEKYPDLTAWPLNRAEWGADTAEEYIRGAYRGGWCYLKKGCAEKLYKGGITLDVNSLYPSRMHSQSGADYPVGRPRMGRGKPTFTEGTFTFLRVKFRFELKAGYLPTIQIKNNPRYNPREYLSSSDYFIAGRRIRYELTPNGDTERVTVTATFTQVDWARIVEHYDIFDCQYLDYMTFKAEMGLFDDYINKWMTVKATSTGAQRVVAKLRLNNLYGKFATRPNGSFKTPYIGDDNILHFASEEESRKPVYIPIGAAVTAYARDYTIAAAQSNYDRFIYSDTDSLHLSGTEIPKGLEIHPTRLGAWAHESTWRAGWFVRAKTYIHINNDNSWDIACAGLPQHCKELFRASCSDYKANPVNDKECAFVDEKRCIQDFKPGITIPGKLLAKTIKGGVVLMDTDFKMHAKEGFFYA